MRSLCSCPLGLASLALFAALPACRGAVAASQVTVGWSGHSEVITVLAAAAGGCRMVSATPCLALAGTVRDSYFAQPVAVDLTIEIAQSAATGAMASGQPLDLCESDPTTVRILLTVRSLGPDATSSGDAGPGGTTGALFAYDSAPLYGMPATGCVLLLDLSAADGSRGDLHAAAGSLTLGALPSVLPYGAPSANIGGSYVQSP